MKKKVALLLALVMIITALPLTVFGNVPGASVDALFTERDQPHLFEVRLPLNTMLHALNINQGANNETGRTHLTMYLEHARFASATAPREFLPVGTANVVLNSRLVGVSLPNIAAFAALEPLQRVAVENAINDAMDVTLVGFTRPGNAYGGDTGSIRVDFNQAAFDAAWATIVAPATTAAPLLSEFVSATGTLAIPINLRSVNHGDWENATMTVRNVAGQALLNNARLTDRVDGRVRVSVPTPAPNFSSQLPLEAITISETVAGTFPLNADGRMIVELVAPAHYTWSFQRPYWTRSDADAGEGDTFINNGHEFTVPGSVITTGRAERQRNQRLRLTAPTRSSVDLGASHFRDVTAIRETGAAGRHILRIQVQVAHNSGLFAGGVPRDFRIEGLWLVPDGNASADGNVYVEARLGQWGIVTPGNPGNVQGVTLQHRFIFPLNADGTVNYNADPADFILSDQPGSTPDMYNANRYVYIRPGFGPGTPGRYVPNATVAPFSRFVFHAFAGFDVNDFLDGSATLGPGLVRDGLSLSWPNGIDSAVTPDPDVDFVRGNLSAAGVFTPDPAGAYVRQELFEWTIPTSAPAGSFAWHVSPDTTLRFAGPSRPTTDQALAVGVPAEDMDYWVRSRTPLTPDQARTPHTQGRWHATGGTGGTADTFGYRWVNDRAVFQATDFHVWTLHVGTRNQAALSIHTYNEQIMRTGHLGIFRPNAAPSSTVEHVLRVPNNRDNSDLAHWTGVATSTLLIEENMAGGFTSGFNAPISFQFLDDEGNPHPGIRILGVQARAGTNGRSDHREGERAGTFYGGVRNNWMTFNGWLAALDQRLPVTANVGRLTESVVDIYLPTQQLTDVRNRGALEVRFFLSLEAGFEWKYGPDVNVTIGGPGVGNLPANQRVHRIGIAQDPIQTNITDNFSIVEVETGNLYNIYGTQAIDDITIDVINRNAFRNGDEIWIYVTSDVIARASDLTIAGMPTLTVTNGAATGLRFDNGRLVDQQISGSGGGAVAFTVIRAPYTNDIIPEIVIGNLNVAGQVFPGVNYRVVLSGTAVAGNEQEVWMRSRDDWAPGGVGAQIRHMNRGVFTTLPYFGSAVRHESGGVWDNAPDGGVGGLAPVRELRLWEGMGPLAIAPDVNVPFFWHIVHPNRIGMVSLRVFGAFVGDNNPTWDQATGTAQVTGTDVHGNDLVVAVQRDNPIAAIQRAGQPVQNIDIATSVNFLSGPAGTVVPVFVNDRIYLPLRFFAETFGYTVHMEGNVVVFR